MSSVASTLVTHPALGITLAWIVIARALHALRKLNRARGLAKGGLGKKPNHFVSLESGSRSQVCQEFGGLSDIAFATSLVRRSLACGMVTCVNLHGIDRHLDHRSASFPNHAWHAHMAVGQNLNPRYLSGNDGNHTLTLVFQFRFFGCSLRYKDFDPMAIRHVYLQRSPSVFQTVFGPFPRETPKNMSFGG